MEKNPVTKQTIMTVFATFRAAGCRMPSNHSQRQGLELGLTVWAALLADVSAPDLLAAAATYLRTDQAQWFPVPGTLLALIPGRRLFDDADEVWGLVLASASTHGRRNPPKRADVLSVMSPLELGIHTPLVWALDPEDLERDAAIHAGIRAVGGWRVVCGQVDNAIRAAFRNAYRGARERKQFDRDTKTARRLLEVAEGPLQIEAGP